MHDELFKMPAIVARYRAGPYVEARERFLRQASAEGYSRSMLKRIAWVLLTTAKAVQSQGGSISSTRLRSLLGRRIRLGNGRRPSQHTASLIRRFGEDWLRSIGALRSDDVQPPWFARELGAFTEYMRVERGLSPVTIATREERMRWFFASLPSQVRSLGDVTVGRSTHTWKAKLAVAGAAAPCMRLAAAYAASSGTLHSRAGAVPASRSASICRVSTHSATFQKRRPSTR